MHTTVCLQRVLQAEGYGRRDSDRVQILDGMDQTRLSDDKPRRGLEKMTIKTPFFGV